MYTRFQLAGKYLLYYFTASNGKGHGIHSPFVFNFIRQVLNDTTRFDAYDQVEALRSSLLNDDRLLEIEDMGAGSGSHNRQRRVADIVRHAAKPPKLAQLLFRMVRYYRSQSIIELGTSAGLTTAYLALANKNAAVISMEGAAQVADLAKKNFEKLQLKNIRVVNGNFDVVLSQVLSEGARPDFIFVDGNHRKAPTLQYFNQLLNCINSPSILIFDDIHWSKEMEEAWEIIKAHQKVLLTADLFFMGLVFFSNEFKIKQHFIIRY
jgi:predicted O-methyltransferase YrrM